MCDEGTEVWKKEENAIEIQTSRTNVMRMLDQSPTGVAWLKNREKKTLHKYYLPVYISISHSYRLNFAFYQSGRYIGPNFDIKGEKL